MVSRWFMYYSSPEKSDSQVIYLVEEDAHKKGVTPSDLSGADYVHDPTEAGYSIRDSKSARRWFADTFSESAMELIGSEVW